MSRFSTPTVGSQESPDAVIGQGQSEIAAIRAAVKRDSQGRPASAVGKLIDQLLAKAAKPAERKSAETLRVLGEIPIADRHVVRVSLEGRGHGECAVSLRRFFVGKGGSKLRKGTIDVDIRRIDALARLLDQARAAALEAGLLGGGEDAA